MFKRISEKINIDIATFITIIATVICAIGFSYSFGFNLFYGIPLYFLDIEIYELVAHTSHKIYMYASSVLLMFVTIKILDFNSYNKFKKISTFITSYWILLVIIPLRLTDSYTLLSISILLTLSFLYNEWKCGNFSRATIVTLLLIVPLSQSLGIMEAMYKYEYPVLEKDNKDYVVLNTYKDSYIVSPIDLENYSIENEFQLIEMKDASVKLIKTGKLKTDYKSAIPISKYFE